MVKFNDFPAQSLKVNRMTKFLNGVCDYIIVNIKKRINVIFESWGILENSHKLNGRIRSLKVYLQVDLNNEEHFYVNVVSTFIERVSSMDDLKRKSEDLPNRNKLN